MLSNVLVLIATMRRREQQPNPVMDDDLQIGTSKVVDDPIMVSDNKEEDDNHDKKEASK